MRSEKSEVKRPNGVSSEQEYMKSYANETIPNSLPTAPSHPLTVQRPSPHTLTPPSLPLFCLLTSHFCLLTSPPLAAPELFGNLQCSQISLVFPSSDEFLVNQGCQRRLTRRKHLF